ncbi:MAG TPA: GIY-YIG nuclease family protein [Parafilimonas sp.]|nr:GIY-YIG nuclease family protein [Parafilimonas sp.]
MQYGGTVYILTNVHHEVLYIGVTSDLFTRIPEHICQGLSKVIHRKI